MKRLVGAVALALLCGCGDETIAPAATGAVAHYRAAVESDLSPYPSDRYTVADSASATGLRLAIGPDNTVDQLLDFDVTLDELNAMDGFSTTGGVVLTFDAPIAYEGVATPADDEAAETAGPGADGAVFMNADAPVLIVDVDPDSPERGMARPLGLTWWEQPADDFYIADEYTLVAQPLVPLRPRTRYLAVVTDALVARDGGPVRRSPATSALIDGAATDAYAGQVRDALDTLETTVGVSRDRVMLATAFTTTSIHGEMLAAADAARARSAPAATEAWTVETPDGGDGRARLSTRFPSPEYRQPLPDGRFVIEDGAPVKQADVDLEVFMAVSDAQTSTRRPVVIYQHGLGGDKDGGWGTAGRLAPLNAAVFSIDSPHHGSRATADGSELTAVFNFFGIDQSDSSFVIGRARDNFRQMSLDQLELVRFIRSLDTLDVLPPGAPDGVPDLDTSRILYIGHSFGSVQGATVFALAPEIEQAVWNVGGAGMMTLLRDSGVFGLLVGSLKPEGASDGSVGRFMTITQAIVDPGDPLNFARFGTLEALPGVPGAKPRDVLIQEVVRDGIVPNSSTRLLARAAGLPVLDPVDPPSAMTPVTAPLRENLPSGATGALSQYDVMNGTETAEHGGLIFSEEAMAQYLEFFRTGLQDGRATVLPAYP